MLKNDTIAVSFRPDKIIFAANKTIFILDKIRIVWDNVFFTARWMDFKWNWNYFQRDLEIGQLGSLAIRLGSGWFG